MAEWGSFQPSAFRSQYRCAELEISPVGRLGVSVQQRVLNLEGCGWL